jgi:cytochrome P450
VSVTDLDPFDLDNLEDPYDLYRRLRESAPIHEVPDMGLFLVSRHADILEAAGRHEDFSSHLTAFVQRGAASGAKLVEASGDSAGVVDVLATADPPDHTRQRKVVSRTFRQIETAEPLIRGLVDEMLDPFVAEGGGDWVGEVAGPLPVRVIARLLGLPESDVDRLRRWSDDGVELLSGVASPQRMAECGMSVLEFLDYLRARLADARTGAPDGILALLADAVTHDGLSDAEAVSMALQLVAAGSDSTGNLIGSSARMLADLPDVQTKLRQDPELIPMFIEEAVRLESPFRGHFRVATRDTKLAGVGLKEGARLFLIWASANRDPEAFDHPDEVRLDREQPRSHLGLGWGIHRCLGAPLARLEARVVVEQLLGATSDIRADAAAPPPAHIPSLLIRRLAHVNVLVDGAT